MTIKPYRRMYFFLTIAAFSCLYFSPLTAEEKTSQSAVLSSAATSIKQQRGDLYPAQMRLDVQSTTTHPSISTQLLLPLNLQPAKGFYFMQLGGQKQQDATTLHFGLGGRYAITPHSGLGYNLFYDRAMHIGVPRLGLGTELWNDFIKGFANLYLPIGAWKQNPHMVDYEQQAAHGFDIGLRVAPPPLPQMGFLVQYAHYFGEQVALHPEQPWQHDPHRWTWGIEYTPFPLLSFHYTHQEDDQKLGVSFTYRFGTSLKEQLTPYQRADLHRANARRFDFVERHYPIVMHYKAAETSTALLDELEQQFQKELKDLAQEIKKKHPQQGKRYHIYTKRTMEANEAIEALVNLIDERNTTTSGSDLPRPEELALGNRLVQLLVPAKGVIGVKTKRGYRNLINLLQEIKTHYAQSDDGVQLSSEQLAYFIEKIETIRKIEMRGKQHQKKHSKKQ